MLKRICNQRAQVVAGEYVLVFFIVASAIGAITVYFRRAMQAKIYDARAALVNMVEERTAEYYNGDIFQEYEPYYVDKKTYIDRESTETDKLIPTVPGQTDLFQKEIDSKTKLRVISVTKPPKDADRSALDPLPVNPKDDGGH